MWRMKNSKEARVWDALWRRLGVLCGLAQPSGVSGMSVVGPCDWDVSVAQSLLNSTHLCRRRLPGCHIGLRGGYFGLL